MGRLESERVLKAGGRSQTGSNRWGDYSSMAVDPANGCDFWYTQEYYASSSAKGWRTAIGRFSMPGCPQPPQTTLGKHPPRRTRRRAARFTFGASEAATTFRCELDRRAFKRCRSPKRYRHLRPGRHRFRVTAINGAGNADPSPAVFRWTILRR